MQHNYSNRQQFQRDNRYQNEQLDYQLATDLSKDEELMRELQYLYFQMAEANPGERFVRTARVINTDSAQNASKIPKVPLQYKKSKEFKPKPDLTIKSIAQLSDLHVKLKDCIEPNENLAKLAPHPVIRIGMVEEEVQETLGRMRLNSFKKNK